MARKLFYWILSPVVFICFTTGINKVIGKKNMPTTMAIHKYTNRLINETSPYLLQHAHNPVDWYPWGKEAFERAKKRG
jgi:hypothetical protein